MQTYIQITSITTSCDFLTFWWFNDDGEIEKQAGTAKAGRAEVIAAEFGWEIKRIND